MQVKEVPWEGAHIVLGRQGRSGFARGGELLSYTGMDVDCAAMVKGKGRP